jgi:hypothetical protein
MAAIFYFVYNISIAERSYAKKCQQCLTESDEFKRAIEVQNRGIPRIYIDQDTSTDLLNSTSRTHKGKHLNSMESWLKMHEHLNVSLINFPF